MAKRYALSRNTLAKCRTRVTAGDASMGPRAPYSTVLTAVEEAMIVEFGRRTLCRSTTSSDVCAFNYIDHRLTKPKHP